MRKILRRYHGKTTPNLENSTPNMVNIHHVLVDVLQLYGGGSKRVMSSYLIYCNTAINTLPSRSESDPINQDTMPYLAGCPYESTLALQVQALRGFLFAKLLKRLLDVKISLGNHGLCKVPHGRKPKFRLRHQPASRFSGVRPPFHEALVSC